MGRLKCLQMVCWLCMFGTSYGELITDHIGSSSMPNCSHEHTFNTVRCLYAIAPMLLTFRHRQLLAGDVWAAPKRMQQDLWEYGQTFGWLARTLAARPPAP